MTVPVPLMENLSLWNNWFWLQRLALDLKHLTLSRCWHSRFSPSTSHNSSSREGRRRRGRIRGPTRGCINQDVGKERNNNFNERTLQIFLTFIINHNITFGFFELGGLQSLQIKSSSSETCSGFSPIHVKCNQSSQPSHWTQWT